MGALKGITGLGNIGNISQYNTVKSHLVGWRFRWDWADMELTPGHFDFSSMEADIQRVVNDGLYFGFQVSISPVDVSPAWLYTPPYNVPKVTGAKQTYPYYFSTVFKQRKQIMLDAVRAWVASWDSSWLDLLAYWFIVDGKTGDEGTGIETVSEVTINGVAQSNPQAYVITNDQWNVYKLTESWPQFFSDLQADLPTVVGAVNPSNNAENWADSIADFENTGLKLGQVTHNYNNIGELFYANRCNALTATIPNNFLFGETENTNDTGWYQTSTRQNTLALILSGITHGNVMQNISLKTFTELININNSDDWWMFDLANDFLGLRDASESDKAIISLRDCLDGANLQRFSESIYGNLVTNQAQYNSKYNAIINSSASQVYKEDQLASLLAVYFNPARGTAIGAAFPNLKFQALDNSNDHDAYNQDGGVYMLGNYKKFINQYDPYNTCVGYARIGSTSQPHGRWCCGTSTEMFFNFDNGIVNNNSYQVTFKIWYYDEGSRKWSLRYWNGTSKVSAGTVTNTNTNTWIEKTYTINDFYGGGNINFGNDFSIKSEDGTITKIEIIRFDRISQNPTGTAGVYLRGNTETTVCDQSNITLYTNGSFAVGKTLYTDSGLTTALTGYSYIVAISNSHIYTVNSATGEVLTDTGFICNSGTIGTYILGNNSGTVCAGSETDLYTSGSFGVGKTLYLDNELINAVTGYDFVVDTATNTIYNLNSSTGVVGSSVGSCTGGTAGSYKTDNDSSTVCSAADSTLYTDGSLTVSSILYTDMSLTTPATGFSFVVRNSNGNIYSVNSGTGQVTVLIGKCGAGISQTVILGNDVSTICTGGTTTVYTSGAFGVGVTLYQDINLINVVTGYDYFVLDTSSVVYNLNNSTGVVGVATGTTCNSGTLTVGRFGNDINTVCQQPTMDAYTDGRPDIGKTIYTDINLTTPLTGYTLAVRNSNGKIFLLNSSTGEILQQVGSCGIGLPIAVLLGNVIPDICAAIPQTVYAIGNFKTGVFLYEDANITTPITGYLFVSANGFIYNLDDSTGEVLSATSQICNTGVSGIYQLSNTLNGICEEPTVTLYLLDKFKKGEILYSDNSLVTPVTGFQYVVNTITENIFEIDSETGEIGRIVKQSCVTEKITVNPIYLYNILTDNGSYKNIMRSVLIDARATTMPPHATGFEIDAIVNKATKAITDTNLFFKLETELGNIVGYFTLGLTNNKKVAVISSLVVRPAFQKNIKIISEQINNFIQTNEYQNYILSAS